MIKKLHYVWFGGKELPRAVKSCINSWRKNCPNWEIIQWDESNFDVERYRWVREAISVGHYAFAADFVRLYVLKNYGGGYLDTDVQILRPIEPVIEADFVSGIEVSRNNEEIERGVSENGVDLVTGGDCHWFKIQAGFMYSEVNHPYVMYCMERLYDNGNRPFLKSDGTTNRFVIDSYLMFCLRDKYGIVHRNFTQTLPDNIKIYDNTVFATRKSKTKDSYLIHWFDQSWKKGSLIIEIKKFIKSKFYLIYRGTQGIYL